ncbi:MAG: Holliday junction resolvase RuvX, partial [Bacteroidetes bacterium]|nr:Holliday junction resolvase RuvX [Bacteroidota bacterium]
GLKRIGIAVTDPLMMFAKPLTTLSPAEVSDFLHEYIKTESVSNFIVGKPLQMDGTDSESAPLVKQFKTWLQTTWPTIPIDDIDERFTSMMAVQSMIDNGIKKQDRKNKKNIDSTAAALILQTWLQKNNNTNF